MSTRSAAGSPGLVRASRASTSAGYPSQRQVHQTAESSPAGRCLLVLRSSHGFARPLRPVDCSGVREAAQPLAARGVAQLAQRLGLDLADALAGDREVLAHFLQRVVGLLADSEAHA